ncbi:nuclear cap-binding protein subunit 1-like [Drosophila sulfurigaster albostrigata]|uniref:nuclear cap-binding protein subunit 1-like n=1 Tax=Drosophila sulfurigaster albostrigata TaxID=89887 RepID=UPI002D21AC67|nr:nuclear cap-binding protein subunit 1-like [Drosophila sulfurigaster albostrigata]
MNRRRQCTMEDDVEMSDRPAKRHRRGCDSLELMLRIERLLVMLSDQHGDMRHDAIEDLSSLVCDTKQLRKIQILRIVCSCVATHPMQTGVYATFLSLVNVRDYEFGSETVNYLQRQFVKHLKLGEWTEARSLLLLLADLVNANLVTVGSMMQLLSKLLDVCDEEESPQARRDFFAYLVMSALPLVGREFYEKKEMALQVLIKRLQLYMSKERCAPERSVAMLHIWSHREMPQQEYLELLWQQLLRLERSNWIEQQMLRPHLAFDDRLSTALQHVLPTQELPPQLGAVATSTIRYPKTRLGFRLFEPSDAPSNLRLPEELDIERYVLESHILELLQLHHLERKLCANQMLIYAASKPQLAVEHCIVEVLLGQMLQLPQAPYLIINYGSIIIELCKQQPSQFSQIVAQAVDVLFTQLEFMSVSSLDRFVMWFSHHLSNFRYQWNWQDWECCTRLPPLHPSPMFVRELFKRCMRLSYREYIVQLVPDSYAALLPPPPDHVFKYIDQLLPGASLANHVLQALRGKSSVLSVGGLVEEADLEVDLKINVFMQCCLHLGCKSFTHVFAILAKFQPVLQMLAHNEDNQLAILSAISEVWANNDHLQFVLVEKMLKTQLVKANVIVDWIFGQPEQLCHMYLWEMIESIIKFAKNQSTQDTNEPSLQQQGFNELFIYVVQWCAKVLTEHEMSYEQKETDYWTHWVLGRLQSLLFNHIEDVRGISQQLAQVAAEWEHCKRLPKLIESYLAYIQ